MKRNVFATFILMISCLFFAGTLYFVVSLASKNSKGVFNSREDFSSLADETYSILDKEDIDAQKLQNLSQNTLNLSYLSIDYNAKNVLEWQKDKDKKSTGAFLSPYTTDFVLSNGKRVEINASFCTLSSSAIFSIAKTAFFIVLVGTLLVVVILVFICLDTESIETTYTKDTKENEVEKKDDAPFSFAPISASSISDIKTSSATDMPPIETNQTNRMNETHQKENPFDVVSSVSSKTLETAPVFAPPTSTAQTSLTDLVDSIGDFSSLPPENDILEDYVPDSKIKEEEEEEGEENKAQGDENGTQAKTTGNDFLENLDSELEKASSLMQDLSFVLVDITGTSQSAICRDLIQTQLKSCFLLEDMIFPYKETGHACILQNTTLDVALKKCEDLHKLLEESLQKIGEKPVISVGLSAKSIRCIDGKRIFNEALQALEHAKQDFSSPIIAFRVDIEKYRQYLGRN